MKLIAIITAILDAVRARRQARNREAQDAQREALHKVPSYAERYHGADGEFDFSKKDAPK